MHIPAPSPSADTRRTRSTGLSRTGALPSARAAFLRDVTLEADFEPTTGEGSLDARIQVGGLFSLGLTVVIRLSDREPVSAQASDSLVLMSVSAGAVLPWSAELPHLHAVTIELADDQGQTVDSVVLKVGYRRIEPIDGALVVNGTPVAITGIAPRIDDAVTQTETPWTGTEEWIAARLVHLKQFNINAIRALQPSIDPLFLSYADELGFYVIDGTDDETERLSAQFASDPRHPDVAEGTVHPAMYELRRRFSPIEFASTADELAAGILRLRNEQFFASLDGFTVTAHVVTTCGVDTGMPLVVSAGPGETALVSMPDTLLYELAGDTVLALRLIVRTATTQRWAREGTEIAALQLTLRENAELEKPAAPGRRLHLDSHGVLRHPYLAAGPRLSLRRAGEQPGDLSTLKRRVDTITWHDDDATVQVHTTYTTGEGHKIRHAQRIRRLVDGTLHFEESVVIPPAVASVPRVGVVLETRAGFDSVEWIGDGPHETYPGRRESALHGQWSSAVSRMPVPYVQPRESGGRANVSWADLSDGTSSMSLAFDRGMQFSASHFRTEDLEAATHCWQLEPRDQTIIHIDVAHGADEATMLGLDGAADLQVGPGTYEWTWTMDAREDH